MRKTAKLLLSLLLTVVMIFTNVSVSFAAQDVGIEPGAADNSSVLEMGELDPASLHVRKLGAEEEEEEEGGQLPLTPDTSLNETVRVSVFLEAPATLDAGYSAEGIGTNDGAISYRTALKANQRNMTAQIESAIGYSMNVKWNLTLLVNAISGYVKVKDIPMIERMDGVASVQRETRYEVPVDSSVSEPNTTNSSSGMVGATTAWSAGYTGAGMRIAIIDTGIDTAHQSFAAGAFDYAVSQLEETPDLMTASDISAVSSQLNGKGTYVSSKIPYGYNYVDENTTIDHLSDTEGEHGSHVAGIAAANRYIKSGSSYVDAAQNVYAVGMAPDAQLLVMKVFGSKGGAYDSDYMAAIEDAVVLDCDACNLSLGSSVQGFTYDGTYQDVMNNLASEDNNEGMVVTISAGNSYALTAFMDTDLYIDDINMHTGGNPGTFINSLCIAAAENIGVTGTPLVFNNQNIYYTETASKGAAMTSIAGTHGFVYIDGIGSTEEYTAVNSAVSLKDKIVIVNRGELSFYEKGNNAISYQPKAVLVANNQGGTISMALDDYTGSFPMASITLADAEMIKAGSAPAAAGDYTYYTGSITVTATTTTNMISAREDAEMCDFSSWGVPGSLLMKPEITAPGGNIYSVFGTNKTTSGTTEGGTTKYELMSGTSMAAPHMAGLSAIVAQYLKETGISVDGYSRRALIQSLLMSTATPMINDGEYVSVLQQGAGLSEASKAISARSAIFMTNAGLTSATGAAYDGKVKAEIGDDPDRTGSYSYSFRVFNLTDETLYFDAPTTDIFTQDYYTYEGDTFMDEATVSAGSQTGYTWIPGGVDVNPYDVNQDGVTTDQDAQAILDYLTGEADGEALDLLAADLDENGSVTSYDAYLLLNNLEQEEETGCYVPANGYADVTVGFDFSVDENIYTAGAYIEGFTYLTEQTGDDGAEGVQHSIPILGYYGSWTDPSVFDNTSYTDTLYGTEKIPYTGNTQTNYMMAYYNGIRNRFTGNPYMVEDEFPAERLAMNGSNNFGNIIYSLYRAAGTTGFAVSRLDEIGGNVTEVINAQVVGAEEPGIYYSSTQDKWQNTSSKFYAVNKSASEFHLVEDDVFRIGFYALPEYYGMLMSEDMTAEDAGILSQTKFKNLVASGILGDGAFIGYDFTVDNTEPEINSVTLNGNELSVSASDNQNLAYVAVMSLDGDTVYAESAPGTDEFNLTFDAADAIANAHGYVAVFAADYAGNEAASAVRVNDNTTVTETLYVRTDSLTSEGKYLIVDKNSAGSGYALGHKNTAVETDSVTVREGNDAAGSEPYIRSADVDATSVWTVSGSTAFKNGNYYLSYSSSKLNCSTTSKTWTAGNNTLYYKSGSIFSTKYYYVTCSSGTWSLNTSSSNVYFYKEQTLTYNVDPYGIDSLTLTPSSLDLYKGNTVNLLAKVLPLTAEDRTVTWVSGNPAVASVDEYGNVTALSAGQTTITATSNANAGVSASCSVKVTSVDKTLNGIVWDEEGGVYFSDFNASSLPAWNKKHTDDKGLELTSAFMGSSSQLYAATLDSSNMATELYTVNRSNYDVTDYGENYVCAMDIAIGASGSNAQVVGMVYPYAYYLLGGPIAPGDDGEGGTYCGLPYGILDCHETTEDAYFVGIAAKSRSSSGGTYYVLDENGVIWQTTLSVSTTKVTFSTPTEVMDTGITTSFLYQNLYYDGTYLYWTHYADNDTTLYIIDPSNKVVYDAGNFGDGVWPVTGMYVNGSVAPAEAGDEPMDGDAPAEIDMSGFEIQARRSELITADIAARYAEEAARFAGKTVTPAEEIIEEAETVSGEAAEEEVGEAMAEPDEAAADTANEAAEAELTAADPADSEPESEEIQVSDPAYTGSLNSVRSTAVTNKAARKAQAAEAAGNAGTEGEEVLIRLYEETALHNGLYTVTYDPDVLQYADTESDAAYYSVHADEEKGTVTFAFAGTEDIAAGDDAAVISFTKINSDGTTVTAATKERNDETLTEEETLTIEGLPSFKTQSLLLSGEIGVNFFMNLPAIDGVDYSESYMTFTITGDGTTTERDDFDAAHMNASGTYYGFTCYINSVQMAETITAVFHYGDGLTVEKTYSVKQYLKAFDTVSSNYDKETVALVHSIGDYGHYVQPMLAATNGWIIGENYAEMDKYYTNSYSISDVIAAVSEYEVLRTYSSDVEKITYKLSLDSGTDIIVYFRTVPGYNGSFSATVDGTAAEAVCLSDGRYRVTIPGIIAHQLGNVYTVAAETDGGSSTVEISALSYVNALLSAEGYSDDLYRNAMASIYYYYEAADNYKATH